MKSNYTNLILLIIVFTSSLSFGQLTNQSIQVGAEARTYKRYLPAGLNPASEQVSLVFVLHGLGGNSSQLTGIGLNTIADTARIIAIYPQGINNSFGQAAWNNGVGNQNNADDIGLFNQLIDSMIINYNVDPSRVYFTGLSMGSIMSYTMACELNNRVAAIGCMSGPMSTEDLNNCNPTHPTPVIHIHGTADGTTPYDSGAVPTLSLVPETMAFWRNVHACNSTADSLRIADTASDGLTVDRFRYDNCSPTNSVELWRINGGGHTYFYQPVNDINEILEIWKFFSRYSHPNPSLVGLDEKNAPTLTISPNPSEGLFMIESSRETGYSIYTSQGRLVQQGDFQSGMNSVNLSGEKSGVYLMRIGTKTMKLVKE